MICAHTSGPGERSEGGQDDDHSPLAVLLGLVSARSAPLLSAPGMSLPVGMCASFQPPFPISWPLHQRAHPMPTRQKESLLSCGLWKAK